MQKYGTVCLVFEVAATDLAMAHHKAFAVFIHACRQARQEGIGVIWRPVHNLENPNLWQPFLGRYRVQYPPPAEQGEKSAHEVRIDLQCVKVDSYWESTEEACDWLRSLFRQVHTEDCRLIAVEDSIVNWN